MERLVYGAASVRLNEIPGSRAGVLEVDFYGLLNSEVLNWFRERLYQMLGEMPPALVVRTDHGIFTDKAVILPHHGEVADIPVALVVPQQTRAIWVDYSRRAAARGITRAVFVSSQLQLAYRWAERRADLSRV